MLESPQRRVAWRTTSGGESSGVVSFEPEADGRTEIRFKMLYDAHGGWSDPAALSERLESNLENFKKLVEPGEC